jgi:hypothetical protein
MPDFQKVLPGDSLNRFPARVYNAMLDKINERDPDSPVESGSERQATIISVRNDTGANLLRGDVVGIGEVLVLPTVNESEFLGGQPLFGGIAPAVGGEYAVLIDSIPNGQIGRAMIDGVVQARVSGAEAAFAEISAGVTSYLSLGATGTARLLWAETGSGERWGVVRLGDGAVGFWARIDSGTNPYAWTEMNPGPAGTFVVKSGGRTGTTTQDPAYETNDFATVAANQIVWMRPALRTALSQEYEFDAPGAGGTGFNAGSITLRNGLATPFKIHTLSTATDQGVFTELLPLGSGLAQINYATASIGGLLSAGAQVIGGNKTFQASVLSMQGFATSNFSLTGTALISSSGTLILRSGAGFNLLIKDDFLNTVSIGGAKLQIESATARFFDSAAGVGRRTKASHNNWRRPGDVATALAELGLFDTGGGPAATTFDSITVDTTLTSTTFTDLLSRTLTTTGGDLAVYVSVSASGSTLAADVVFRLMLDGAAVVGSGTQNNITAANAADGVAIVKLLTGLSAGSHTVKLQWRMTSAAATGQIRPVTEPDFEHCSMLISEVN